MSLEEEVARIDERLRVLEDLINPPGGASEEIKKRIDEAEKRISSMLLRIAHIENDRTAVYAELKNVLQIVRDLQGRDRGYGIPMPG